jgi:hypothetical protein
MYILITPIWRFALKRLICCAALLAAASTCFAAQQPIGQLSPTAIRWFVVGICALGAGVAVRHIRRKDAASAKAKTAALAQAATNHPEA